MLSPGFLRQAPLLPKLRGQFAEFLKKCSLERLRILSSPTSVSFSTVPIHVISRRDFLGTITSAAYTAQGSWIRMKKSYAPFSATSRTRTWANLISHLLSFMRPSWAPVWEGRNINLLSIDYAFRPRLRYRLTLRGFPFRRKP